MRLRACIALGVLIAMVEVSGVLSTAGAQPGNELQATISLGRDPEPPYCAQNPGGTVEITWNIQHTTTPSFVNYKLEDPTRTIIIESQTYPGSTGLNVTRNFTVPPGSVEGKYWIRIEYWSFEVGNEANAEVTFYICNESGTICARKYEDDNCDGQLDPGDLPVSGYFLCVVTPFGDQFCRQTDANGQVCWDGIPTGSYTVKEFVLPGWVAAGPIEYPAALGAGESLSFDFLNQRLSTCYGACCRLNGVCEMTTPDGCGGINGIYFGLGSNCDTIGCVVPVEPSSWGMIKSVFR